jgi:hypothetical protein
MWDASSPQLHRIGPAAHIDSPTRWKTMKQREQTWCPYRSRSAGRPQNVQGLVFESVTGTSVASYEPGRRKRYGLFFQGVSEQPPGRGVEDPLSLGTSGR